MKRMILGVLLATTLCGGMATADDDTGAVFLSPMAQWNSLGSNRHADDNIGGQIGLGYNFAPGWAAEFIFNSMSTNRADRAAACISTPTESTC